MKTRGRKIEDGEWLARSVWECGGPPPLSDGLAYPSCPQSARGLAQSKTWRLWLACFCHLLSTLCFRAWGQYSIEWHTIDGGGGTSTGGIYSITGTIGQPDAGSMSGGNYTLQGGFGGAIAAVQTPGVPLLSIIRTTTNTVVVWWALSEFNWQLQSTTALSVSANWTDIPPPYTTNAPNCHFTEPPPAGTKFFRLRN